MFLQSDLLRVVGFQHVKGGSADIRVVYGTAFLLGQNGVFLTANHAMQAALAKNPDGLIPAVVGVKEEGSLVGVILEAEAAPNGQDIAIGRANYAFDSWYKIGRNQCEVWQRVAAAGYPEDAIVRDEKSISIPLRAYKGIVQRVIRPGELHLAPKSQGYELSFTPSPGVSGAPLFIYKDTFGEVIGVCVGSFRSEQVEDEFTEVSADGSKYTEKRVKITQFGLAESLRPLLDWRPKCLEGKSLEQAFAVRD